MIVRGREAAGEEDTVGRATGASLCRSLAGSRGGHDAPAELCPRL